MNHLFRPEFERLEFSPPAPPSQTQIVRRSLPANLKIQKRNEDHVTRERFISNSKSKWHFLLKLLIATSIQHRRTTTTADMVSHGSLHFPSVHAVRFHLDTVQQETKFGKSDPPLRYLHAVFDPTGPRVIPELETSSRTQVYLRKFERDIFRDV
ncbi:hypothetical protein RUM44_006367 [Polyplax serrata]|uniref:Uncharacterized protein n=1 Tax=Polyplax serrata TaxID=468196 RepID=A0ABR1AHW7_POLSC